MQVLCIFTAQGGVRCETIHMGQIAVHSAKGCCTGTTMTLTSIKKKLNQYSSRQVSRFGVAVSGYWGADHKI